jgi:hypothetical protein
MTNFLQTFTILVTNSFQMRFVLDKLLYLYPNIILRDKNYFYKYFENNTTVPYICIVKQQYEIKFFKNIDNVCCEYEIAFHDFKQLF